MTSLGARPLFASPSQPVAKDFLEWGAGCGQSLGPIDPASGSSYSSESRISDDIDIPKGQPGLSSSVVSVRLFEPTRKPANMDGLMAKAVSCSSLAATPVEVDVPGADKVLAGTFDKDHAQARWRKGAFVVARTGQLVAWCGALSSKSSEALATARSCAADVVLGAKSVKKPGSDAISVRLRLLTLEDSKGSVALAGGPEVGCHRTGRPLLLRETPTVDVFDDGLNRVGTVSIQTQTVEAAKSVIKLLRPEAEGCEGRFSVDLDGTTMSGKAGPVSVAKFGDGGFAFTQTISLAGSTTTEPQFLFSVGPYVVHVVGTSDATATSLAKKAVAALDALPAQSQQG